MTTRRFHDVVRLRCISVKDPWAAEIASGKKTIELRKYAISLGPLGICSTASKWGSGRLLCIVDVVDVLPPGHPWLAAQGVRGFYGWVLENVRAGKDKPAVSGNQGIWHLDVTGDWAELVGADDSRARSSRRGPDTRTRADKLRDLAEHPTASKGERDNALAELARMEAARLAALARELQRKGKDKAGADIDIAATFGIEMDTEAADRAAAKVMEAERVRIETARQAEARRRAEAEDRAERERAEREAREKSQREAEEARKTRIAETEEKARRAKEEAEAKEAEALQARIAARRRREEARRNEEGSPLRVRKGAGDACPLCGGAVALERGHEDPMRRTYRCGRCREGFDVIESAGGFPMYERRRFRSW